MLNIRSEIWRRSFKYLGDVKTELHKCNFSTKKSAWKKFCELLFSCDRKLYFKFSNKEDMHLMSGPEAYFLMVAKYGKPKLYQVYQVQSKMKIFMLDVFKNAFLYIIDTSIIKVKHH